MSFFSLRYARYIWSLTLDSENDDPRSVVVVARREFVSMAGERRRKRRGEERRGEERRGAERRPKVQAGTQRNEHIHARTHARRPVRSTTPRPAQLSSAQPRHVTPRHATPRHTPPRHARPHRAPFGATPKPQLNPTHTRDPPRSSSAPSSPRGRSRWCTRSSCLKRERGKLKKSGERKGERDLKVSRAVSLILTFACKAVKRFERLESRF